MFSRLFGKKKEVFAEKKAEDFLKKYLPVAKSELTKNAEQALKFAKKYPIVLKIISPQALHKTEIKGIRIVNNKTDLVIQYQELEKIVKANKLKLEGILAQEYIKGKEVIVGIKKDATFGHVIMFGTGGIYTEMLKDVQFRSCPITEKDAEQMIADLKLNKLLTGFRNEKPVNLRLLKEILVKASKIPKTHPKIEELDINPLMINSKDAKVVDARIVFS
ncbi:MAG: acetate--CoA ligase family protein [Candidatus Woesearchaeota archaeon]